MLQTVRVVRGASMAMMRNNRSLPTTARGTRTARSRRDDVAQQRRWGRRDVEADGNVTEGGDVAADGNNVKA